MEELSSHDALYTGYYSIVGVAVAMVIFTVHEKACLDFDIARNSEKKFQNPVIHTSRNHIDEIAEAS